MRELPPGERAVLVLRYFDDLTEAETARVLGCSVGTVKSRAFDNFNLSSYHVPGACR